MDGTYLEDLEPGDERTFGSFTVTRDDILAFGRRYDPQPFHVDQEAAAASAFGGLIASGWHTAALTMRTLVEGFGEGFRSLGARGVDHLRWVKPVRPGDRLHVSGRVLETATDPRHPERGDVRYEVSVRDDGGELVMTFVSLFLIERRSA